MNQGEDSELKFIAALGCHLNQTINLSGSFNKTLKINSIELPGPGNTKSPIGNYFGNTTIWAIAKLHLVA